MSDVPGNASKSLEDYGERLTVHNNSGSSYGNILLNRLRLITMKENNNKGGREISQRSKGASSTKNMSRVLLPPPTQGAGGVKLSEQEPGSRWRIHLLTERGMKHKLLLESVTIEFT